MDLIEAKTEAGQFLEAAAIAAEKAGSAPVAWATTWSSLKTGARQITHAFASRDRYYLVLSDGPNEAGGDANANAHGNAHANARANANAQAAPRSGNGRPAVDFLELWLSGASQKVLAIDSSKSASTISNSLQRGLNRLGIACLPSRAPMLIGMLAAAAAGDVPLDPGRVAQFEYHSRQYLVLGVGRPEALLLPYVTPAEYTTLCMLAEGASYAQIASFRHVAFRTVANQAASVFRRLSISSRSELQRLLVRCAAGEPIRATISGSFAEARREHQVH